MRNGDSASLVLPAHTLKGEARHFGALSLGDLAETIEMGARRCVDHQETPEELLVPVARLRSMFEQTLAWFDKETNRSEEHTSELQSLMRISYAVFCLKKKKEN